MGTGAFDPAGFEAGYGYDANAGYGYDQGQGYDQNQAYGYGQDQAYGYDAPAGQDYRSEVAALVPEGTPMLAAILIEQGILQQDGLQAALARQAETGDSLAHALIDLDLVAPDQLVTAIQTRASLR